MLPLRLFLVLCLCMLPLHPAYACRSLDFEGNRYSVCELAVGQQQLALYNRDDHGRPFKTFAALRQWLAARGQRLLWAMNAGMYQDDFTPLGLYLAPGQPSTPLNLRSGSGNFYLQPNGVFAITRNGALIMDSQQFNVHAHDWALTLATQSGPMLIRDGVMHPAFHADSLSRLYRNGVGVVDPGLAIFAISEQPVNFHQFARLFQQGLHCRNALYLDGTVSSLYAPELHRDDQRAELGTFVGVSAALP